MQIDQMIDTAFAPVSKAVESVIFYAVPFMGHDIKLIVVWLAAVALFFTVYLGFINFRYFGHAVDIVRGKYDDTHGGGQISSFQALMTSLSATVGLGNIAGVAVAISVGGPGAAFWMMVMGFFGMASKFAESALGMKYRHHDDPENPQSVSGGPMYYLRDGFARRGWGRTGKGLAVLFSICVIGGAIGGGNMFQANQSFQQIVNISGGTDGWWADKGWLFGVILSCLVGVVIIGGIKSIARVASTIVPVMGLLYLIAGLVVIGLHYDNIPGALETILKAALVPEAGFGALLGALLMGVQRAAFSNEAGIGSAAIVHAAAQTKTHIGQGFVAMLGPFIDTVVICMVTALVIVITGVYESGVGMEGVALTSRAFEAGIPWFPYVLAVFVILFAYSTLIGWSYFGLKGVNYLFGEGRVVDLIYKISFCLFVIVGAAAAMDNIVAFSDALLFSMAIPNVIGLYFLAGEVKKDLKEYLQANVKK
jgi:AGCS family alanine or glycine:cation symporter